LQSGAGTTELDKLGGLLKRMPWTGAVFLFGAVAICGLPPLNGFVSEFLIYLSAFEEEIALVTLDAIPPLAVVAGLALIGGLAMATFAKAFGLVFLGVPRSEVVAKAEAVPLRMRWPMILLAVGCVLVSLSSGVVLTGTLSAFHGSGSQIRTQFEIPALGMALVPTVSSLTRPLLELTPSQVEQELAEKTLPLVTVTQAGLAFLIVIGVLAGLRRVLLRNRTVSAADTWGCGYTNPTPRMQYTSTSFSQPLTELFRAFLRPREQTPRLTDYFPTEATLTTDTRDLFGDKVYRPSFLGLGWLLGKLRFLQHGRVQLYVLYIAVTILVLLIWYLGVVR
jgi:NADH:ubiquinone oxidoreductase subunit 5 (subunit L)/multisubunit Na+/H+ antiporter MnhA subunit